MIWLFSQMAVIILIAALLAAAIGFWVRGWIVADERATERHRWQRELREANKQHGATDSQTQHLQTQLQQLQQDYQVLLSNERRLYNELDDIKSAPQTHRQTPIHEPEDSTIIKVGAGHWADEVTTTAASEATAETEAIAPESDETKTTLLSEPKGQADNLKKISGIGPKLANQLNALGIYHYWQIAEWQQADADWVSSKIKVFAGRIERDGWIKQAKELAN